LRQKRYLNEYQTSEYFPCQFKFVILGNVIPSKNIIFIHLCFKIYIFIAQQSYEYLEF